MDATLRYIDPRDARDAPVDFRAAELPLDAGIAADLARFQAELDGWEGGGVDLSECSALLQRWGNELWNELLPSHFNGELVSKPELVFTFDRQGARVLGHYRSGRNGIGLLHEVGVNARHLGQLRPDELAAVLLHELVHCFEDTVGAAPRADKKNYHSVWFRRTADRLGIPCTTHGAARGIVVDSPFGSWCVTQGLASAPVWGAKRGAEKGAENAASSGVAAGASPRAKRVPWTCGCAPKGGVQVLVARASVLKAHCDQCGEPFVRTASPHRPSGAAAFGIVPVPPRP
jgi:hypothetical protein